MANPCKKIRSPILSLNKLQNMPATSQFHPVKTDNVKFSLQYRGESTKNGPKAFAS